MARRALIEHRPWLLAGVTAALTYYFVWNNPIGGIWLIALKGASVGLLAVYVARRADGADAALLSGALIASAIAAMVIELFDAAGLAVFALSHGIALLLFGRNHREDIATGQRISAAALALGTPLVAWMLTRDGWAAGYAAILGLMAVAAWTSIFPRARVGTGALLLIASDMLEFSRTGGFNAGELPNLLAWPLFYAGLLLIASSVVQTMRGKSTLQRGGAAGN